MDDYEKQLDRRRERTLEQHAWAGIDRRNPKPVKENDMSWITAHWQDLLAILGGIYAVATAIALITPTDKDNTLLDKIGKWADKIGLKIKGK